MSPIDRHSTGDSRVAAHPTSLPPEVRDISGLARVDYTDAFLLATGRARERTAEGWVRSMLEGASASTRHTLQRGWSALGVRLGPADDPDRVLGWALRRSSPDVALLGARSWLGMDAEVFLRREPDALLVGTIMKLNNPLARAVWALVSTQHQYVLRRLLENVGSR